MAHRRIETGDTVVLGREPDFMLGGINVRPSLLRLERDGRSLVVEPRVMQVLVALARSPGAVVTIDTLVARCWNGRVVGDGAIHRVMSRIRRLSADLGAGAFRLENIPRVGYRLVVDARVPPRSPRSAGPGWTGQPWLVGTTCLLALLLAAASRGSAMPRRPDQAG
jgi:DNA-binding winged helix-turn-helix (wHTH) protein